MGREIRRVPADWEHPKDVRGHYQPMFDRTHQQAVSEWDDDCYAFIHDPEEQAKAKQAGCASCADWHGDRPDDDDYYRPEWPEGTAIAYQVYETVSEGTPTSPVFNSKVNLRAWLIGQGHSEDATDKFIEMEWAPSMIVSARAGVVMGIDSLNEVPG